MKTHFPALFVFAFFTWLGWACGIGDAFVTDEIESIENPRDRAWAWENEHFFQSQGRYPNQHEADSMRKAFDARWPDSSAVQETAKREKGEPRPADRSDWRKKQKNSRRDSAEK